MKNKLIYIITTLALFASGCNKEEETILNVVETHFNITEKGGTGVIVVETNAALTAESNVDWCTVSVSGRQAVNVSVSANNGLTNRTATVTLTAGDKTAKVPVTQEGAKQPSRILTYEELLGDYTLTAKLGGDWYFEGTTFTSTLHLEPLEEYEGIAYKATIDGYMPDEAFFGYHLNGTFEQFPLVFIYYEGNLIIPNFQLIAMDSGVWEDEENNEPPMELEWAVLYIAVSSQFDISDDDELFYIGQWNESLNKPVFTFTSLSPHSDFQVIGFAPYWWNVEPDDEEFDVIDEDLFLYDWILTKKEAIP